MTVQSCIDPHFLIDSSRLLESPEYCPDGNFLIGFVYFVIQTVYRRVLLSHFSTWTV